MGLSLKKVARVGAAPFTGGASFLNPSSSTLKRAGLGLATGGMSEIFGLLNRGGGSATDASLPPDVVKTQEQARALQRQGMTALSEDIGDPSQVAQNQVTSEQQALRGSFGDARRRLQSLVAARGLRGSSIGLGQEVGLQRAQSKELGQLKASLPERIRQLKLARAQAQLSGAGQALGQPGVIPITGQTQPEQNKWLSLLGLGGGALLGGAPGAAIGLGAAQIYQS